jgi:hypothetical protein
MSPSRKKTLYLRATRLLANGADVDAKASFGETPLDMDRKGSYDYDPGKQHEYKELAELLRRHGGHE